MKQKLYPSDLTDKQRAILSQSVKTTELAREVGYDGAKLVKGHKRHVLVDTLGLLLQVVVSATNVSEKAGALLSRRENCRSVPTE